MTAILEIENLHKQFSGLQVLIDVNLKIDRGERHAIIGPNGSGKTTLFNIVTGRYRPTRGRVRFRDTDITGWSRHRIARLGLSRSFQVINVFPRMTVYENVRNAVVSKLGRRFDVRSILGRDGGIETDARRFVDLLGLSSASDVVAAELSYGEQRRLELALTMAREPELILLDEPTAGLNSEETRGAVALIRELTAGRTLVMVEHDMDVVFTLADRISVLSYGRVLASGTPDEIRANEQVQKAYLGR
jgi:branched-chain amino acid transport system ATP-binding protein